MARFYAEANFRVLAAQHEPPFLFATFAQINEGVAFLQDYEDLLMPWTFGDQTLVPQAVNTFDKFSPASSLFGDILRYDGALHLAMRWAYAPGPKGEFDPIQVLLRDFDFYRDTERALQLSEKNNLDLAFRFLKGNAANKIRGRLEVYEIISGVQKHIQLQTAPLTGRRMLELIFEQLHPRHLSKERKDQLWRTLAKTCVTVLADWDNKLSKKEGKIAQLKNPQNPVVEALRRYIRSVRSTLLEAWGVPRFPDSTLWKTADWSVAGVYSDRVPRIAVAQLAFDKLIAEHASAIRDASEGGVALPPETLDELFPDSLPPADELEQFSPFFDPNTSPQLFCCGCLYAYLRLGIAGFIVPETMNIAGTRVPTSIKERRTQKMKNMKLAVMTQFWILRAYETNCADRVVDSNGEVLPIVDKLRQLHAHWVLASTSGEREDQEQAQEFIRTISAVLREAPWTGNASLPPDLKVDAVAERLQSLRVDD